jgi:hypothetical protein
MSGAKPPDAINRLFLSILNDPVAAKQAMEAGNEYAKQMLNRTYSVRFTMPAVVHANVLVEAESELAAMTKAQELEIHDGEWRYGSPIDPKAKPRPTQVTPIGWEAMLPPRLLAPGETADFEVTFYKVSTKTHVVNAKSREHAASIAESLRLEDMESSRKDEGVWVPHIKQLRKKETKDGQDPT